MPCFAPVNAVMAAGKRFKSQVESFAAQPSLRYHYNNQRLLRCVREQSRRF